MLKQDRRLGGEVLLRVQKDQVTQRRQGITLPQAVAHGVWTTTLQAAGSGFSRPMLGMLIRKSGSVKKLAKDTSVVRVKLAVGRPGGRQVNMSKLSKGLSVADRPG